MEQKTKLFDVFAYLGIFISLVVSVMNIINVLFAAIDRRFTDVLTARQYVDVYGGDIRLAAAFLVVAFPIYLVLSWYISKDVAKFPEKLNLFIRKLFMYGTIFVTACTLLGSLVAIIYTYLGGELTTRFGLKVLVVVIVALAVGGYYVYTLRKTASDSMVRSNDRLISRLFLFGSIVFVIASLVWSISIVGTPSQLRLMRLDATRLSDISGLQQELFNHVQTADKLPATLDELSDAFQGYVVPTDPVTHAPYTYTIIQQPVVKVNYQTNHKELTTPAIFELCATFDTVRQYNDRGAAAVPIEKVSPPATAAYYAGDTSSFWNHGIGKTCFKRTITAEMYYGK